VSGVVLCATAARFADDGGGRPSPFGLAMAATLRLTPPVVRRQCPGDDLHRADTALSPGASPSATSRSGGDPRRLTLWSAEPARGSANWLLVASVTERDRWADASTQLALAVGASITVGCRSRRRLPRPARFLPILSTACHSVAGGEPAAHGLNRPLRLVVSPWRMSISASRKLSATRWVNISPVSSGQDPGLRLGDLPAGTRS
jgi:hypothetical protein